MATKILEALAVASELTDAAWSEAACKVAAKKLAKYPERHVLHAIDQAMTLAKGRLTLNDILHHLPDPDGWLGADEAWAQVPKDEGSSGIVCRQMLEAWTHVAGTFEYDRVAARMAFREMYERLVTEAKANGERPNFHVSLGHEPGGRAEAVEKAVLKGLITQEHAEAMLPDATLQQMPRNSPLLSNPQRARGELQQIRGLLPKSRTAID